MKILGINTSGANGEICIKNDDIIFTTKIKSPYSENIMTAIQNTLIDANLSLSDIDSFGIVTGPGSFTGIRIGMAVIKGILCGIDAKCVSINSFELVSYNIKDNDFIVILDSGNADSYYGIFKNRVIDEIGFGTVEQISQFASNQNLKIYYSSLENEKFEDYEMLQKTDVDKNTLANLCYQKSLKNDFTSIEKLSPIYIKLSQAEIGLEQKMKENLSFREANSVDVESLSIVDEQCFAKGSERYSKQSFEGELAEKSKKYFVALYGNLVIGYVGLQTLGDDLNLLKIAVLPQYQKLGVGFKLMEMSFEYRKNQKLTNYFLEVREDNKKAIKLYQKFGFKAQSVREKYYDDGTNALVMFAK